MFQLCGILLVSTDTKKLEHIQQKFVALPPWPWQLQVATKLKLHTVYDRRHHLDAEFCTNVY
jgi:hypothetical protein